MPYRRRNWTPDGPRHKALGNSMAVNVMNLLGKRIELVEQTVERRAFAGAVTGKSEEVPASEIRS